MRTSARDDETHLLYEKTSSIASSTSSRTDPADCDCAASFRPWLVPELAGGESDATVHTSALVIRRQSRSRRMFLAPSCIRRRRCRKIWPSAADKALSARTRTVARHSSRKRSGWHTFVTLPLEFLLVGHASTISLVLEQVFNPFEEGRVLLSFSETNDLDTRHEI